MGNWADITGEIERMLRLRTFPLAMKFFKNEKELQCFENLRRLKVKVMFCQMVTIARTFGWSIYATAEDFKEVSIVCPSVLGLREKPEVLADGTFRSLVWFKNKQEAYKCEQEIPTIPPGIYRAVALAPLAKEVFEPDLVLLYGNPAQMILMINGLQWDDYERMHFYCVGESACADSIVQCFLTGKPSLAIPCFGERSYGHVAEDELVIAIPPGRLEKMVIGLQNLARKGVRYPIPVAGSLSDPRISMPKEYIEGLKTIK